MTSKGYEKNVYLAMLAEQCNRFEEMSDYLEDLLKGRDKDINSDERNLLSIAYKNSVSSRRTALRTIMAYEMKEKKKETSTFLPYIQEYRKKVEDELTKMCNNVIATIDNHLLKKADDAEAKVFYLKMKGDYNRYIAEYAQSTLKDTVSKGALEAYQSASNIAKESLNAIHPISLGLALNFSVFYYEVMNDHETACKIAKDTLDFANSVPNLDEEDETQRDAIQIINLLRENLEMWKLEAEEAAN
jgi:14-3-3 protein epsilon